MPVFSARSDAMLAPWPALLVIVDDVTHTTWEKFNLYFLKMPKIKRLDSAYFESTFLAVCTGCLITNGSLFQGSTAQPLDHLAGK
jgi:hypothetical protein